MANVALFPVKWVSFIWPVPFITGCPNINDICIGGIIFFVKGCTVSDRLSSVQRNIEIEIDDNLKQLSYYSIQSGDTILLRW